MSHKLLGLILISFIIYTSSKPINSTSQAIDFMKKFGYFGKPSETEALLTEEAVIYGLMKVQRFVGLPQTGRLDFETIQILNTPRCGNPDLPQESSVLKPRRQKRFVLGSNGWEKRKLTYFVANWTPKLQNETFVKSELKRAFQMWADYSGLEFSLSNDYYNSDIIILFGRYSHGDAFPFDGPGFVLAHAYYPYELGTFGGDIHFDEDEDWNQGLDFFTVAVHEIGHALGLAHSSAPDSIMFPYYKGKSEGFALGYDDILAMYQLYISRPFVINDEDESNQTEDTSSTSSQSTTTSVSSTFSTETEDTLTEIPTVTSMIPTTIKASTERESSSDSSLLPTVTLTYDGDISDKDSETTTLTYLGDVEEVEDHLKKQEMMHPDICQGNFDAVTSLRNEVFIFKGLMMWRFSARAQLRPGYPAPFKQMFMGLPEHVRKVDAVYERPGDNHILFFTGRQYWIFDGARFFAPQNISSLGLPTFVDKLDDVFVWGKNGKTYFFYQNLYWRFSPEKKAMDPGYPKDIIRNWRGIPRNIDAALTSVFDGRTYFFQGTNFWTFDDYSIQANQARNINGFWTNCKNY